MSLVNKIVGLNPMYHNCAKGKKRQREFTYPIFPWITGTENKMLLIILLGLVAKLTLVSGDCVVGNQNVNINWNAVGISVLKQCGRY